MRILIVEDEVAIRDQVAERLRSEGFVVDTAKTLEQQDIQGLHRIRQSEVKQRKALANQIRGLLGEYGMSLRSTKAFFLEWAYIEEGFAAVFIPINRSVCSIPAR